MQHYGTPIAVLARSEVAASLPTPNRWEDVFFTRIAYKYMNFWSTTQLHWNKRYVPKTSSCSSAPALPKSSPQLLFLLLMFFLGFCIKKWETKTTKHGCSNSPGRSTTTVTQSRTRSYYISFCYYHLSLSVYFHHLPSLLWESHQCAFITQNTALNHVLSTSLSRLCPPSETPGLPEAEDLPQIPP